MQKKSGYTSHGYLFYLNQLNGNQIFISNNREHIVGEILDSVFIQNGKIVTFLAPKKPKKNDETPPIEIKRIPWRSAE